MTTPSEKPELKMDKGFTVAAYFPSSAPPEVVNAFFDRVSVLATEIEREGWDPFIFGQAGDPMRVEEDKHHDCCPPHVYFSTSCFHGDHNYCQSERGLLGNKTPAVCKFCEAPCVCKCHRTETRETVDGV